MCFGKSYIKTHIYGFSSDRTTQDVLLRLSGRFIWSWPMLAVFPCRQSHWCRIFCLGLHFVRVRWSQKLWYLARASISPRVSLPTEDSGDRRYNSNGGFYRLFESALVPGLLLMYVSHSHRTGSALTNLPRTSMWYKQKEQSLRFGLWTTTNGLLPVPFLVIYWGRLRISVALD